MKVALINYLNSLPYVYAMEQYRHLLEKITIVPPSQCVSLFFSNQVDAALLPIAALHKHKDIVRLPFGIAAKGKVKSVVLASLQPIKKINTILVDPESVTSNILAQILCKYYWQIHPTFIDDNTHPWDGCILIGDKVFTQAQKFPHVYDLAEEWYSFTCMPMVFARWTVRPSLSEQKVNVLLSILSFAVKQKNVCLQLQNSLSYQDAYDYINHFVQYELDEQCLLGETQFLAFLKSI
ncbi:MAG: hypothetical protein N2Z72_01510 [Bacteroidales bacterium]|nr:hypothetical protein [Bacteroidales bacterium]